MKLTDKDAARFRSKLRPDPETGCILWTGYVDRLGYGIFRVGRTIQKAHRVAFVLAGGVLTPEKGHVLHSCPAGDNKRCCNEEHLRAGSNADNMRDVAVRLQGVRGKKGLPFGARQEKSGRFTAQASFSGTTRSFGTFDTWQEASAIAMLHKNLALFPDIRVN